MATAKEWSLLLETRPGFLDKPFIFCFLGLSVLLGGCANPSGDEERYTPSDYEKRYVLPNFSRQMQELNREIDRKSQELNDRPKDRERLREELKELYQQQELMHREWMKPDVW